MYKNIDGFGRLFSSDKALFWCSIFAVIVGFISVFSDICFSFSAGFLLAYLCVPFVDKASKHINRAFLSFLCTISLIAFFGVILINVFPIISDYFARISENAPEYYRKTLDLIERIGDDWGVPQIREMIGNLRLDMLKHVDQNIYIVSSVAQGIASQCRAMTGFVSFFVIMTLSFYYFLKDWNVLKNKCFAIVPIRQKETLRQMGLLTRKTLRHFLQGQFCIVMILSIYYGGLLYLVDVQHFIMLGIISGFLSFIPFIGAIISLVIVIFISATKLSLIQFYGIVVGYLMGQLIEGYFLSPKFVGKTTGLHPLWILFSFFAGYQLMGIVGVFIAIPLISVLANLLLFSLEKFWASQTYKQ